MNRITIALVAAFTATFCAMGCNKTTKPQNASSPTMAQEVQHTVTGMAGEAAFKAGKKAEKKVNALNQQHNADLDKALQD